MKHCPNIKCPFIEQTGFISEFRDEVSVCADCGTALADGPAPPLLELPPLPVDPAPLSEAQKKLMWTVASYSDEEPALADLEHLLEEDIEAVISPEQVPDEKGALVTLYHIQVLPINRFVAQAALDIGEPEDAVDDDYWDELDAAGHFGESAELEESASIKLLDEPENAIEDDYEDEWDAAEDFSEYDESTESVYAKLLEEPDQEPRQFPILMTIITILLILVLLWTMTRAYQLF